MPPRILLVNPPGTRRYLRDCFCSQTARADYYWHPLDLLLQSGWLSTVGEVTVLDAIVEGLSHARSLERVASARWDAILFLTSEKSATEDHRFVAALRAMHPGATLFGCGDVLFFREALPFGEIPGLRGIVTDFAAGGLAAYLAGKRGTLPGLRYLDDDGSVRWEAAGEGPARYPLPRHEAFSRRYRLPFADDAEFAGVLASYGCPFPCTFCNTARVGFRLRPVEDVLDELALLRRLGTRRVYFRDATFACHRREGLELCRAMVERGLTFRWSAFTRPDILDAELLEAMAASGCVLLHLGFETDDARVLAPYGKRLAPARVRAALRHCRRLGIAVAGHFMIGLHGQTDRDADRLVEQAVALGCDYFSLNIAEARLGASLDHRAPDLDPGRRRFLLDEERLRATARRLTLRFYLRPAFAFRELRRVRSLRSAGRLLSLGARVLLG